jgi:nucleolar pre-ribosomal-associated protein 2
LHALLHRWLESAVLEISPVTRALLELIYNAGAETLFNLETLRHAHDTKSENFFDAIKAISNSNAQVLSCLPRLFASYVHSIQKHRSALFIQGSNQQLGAATEELRASAMSFFAASDSLLDAVESNAQIWSIKVALLHLVNHEGLYNRNQAQASVLHRIVESARETLGKGEYFRLIEDAG